MALTIERVIIIGLFVYILFLSMCSTPKTIKGDDVVFHSTDTIFETDTIITEVVKNHYHIKPVNVHDTILLTASQIALLDTFLFEVNDSVLTAKITALSEKQPLINFSYKVKNFEIKNKITIKDSIIREPLKNELYFGAVIGGGVDNFIFAPKLDFKTKRGFIYSGGYDLINKSILIGIGKKLTFFAK